MFRYLREFVRLEAAGGLALIAAAVAAIVVANSPLNHLYTQFLDLPIGLHVGRVALSKPLILWINEGFMSLFFLLVGLEIKRELFEGALSERSGLTLPVCAAIGGVVLPGLVYFMIAGSGAAADGWAIPTATDIAFSLAILSLVGRRVPMTLKAMLTAIAIFDDLAAIALIAIFYSSDLQLLLLIPAALLLFVLWALNLRGIQKLWPYLLTGALLWLLVVNSGVHATLVGIVVAFAIPVESASETGSKGAGPLRLLEKRLHPWIAAFVLPCFAFANAGITFSGMNAGMFLHPISLGIALGLFLAKPIGVMLASFGAVRYLKAPLPEGTNWTGMFGLAQLCGIGFTMSLFIGTLAFPETTHAAHTIAMRMGVFIGSLCSAIVGYCVLRYTSI